MNPKDQSTQCELWRPVIESRTEKSFKVSRPPFWEHPQEWPKSDILKAMDFIILAGQGQAVQSKSDISFILRRKLEEDMIWIENVMYQIEKLEKVQMVEKEKER